ncbi:MAG: PDZ domain-containing protein [Chloroflexi bacterium]|nr:PDZ domain-containing protein [Chloroflexota bacterium]
MLRRKWVLAVLAAVMVAALGIGAVLAAPSGRSPQDSAKSNSGDSQEQQGHPFLGVVLVKLNERIAQRLAISSTEGVAIAQVVPEGPADEAGAKVGDVILTANGTEMDEPGDVTKQLRDLAPGDQVTLTVLRAGQQITLTVTLGETPRPKDMPQAKRRGPKDGLQRVPDIFSRLIQGNLELMGPSSTKVVLTVTPGKVTAVTGTTLTIERRDGQSAQFTVPEGTPVMERGREIALSELEAGTPVVVFQKDGQVARVTVGPQAPSLVWPHSGGGVRPTPPDADEIVGHLREAMEQRFHRMDTQLDRLEERLDGHLRQHGQASAKNNQARKKEIGTASPS